MCGLAMSSTLLLRPASRGRGGTPQPAQHARNATGCPLQASAPEPAVYGAKGVSSPASVLASRHPRQTRSIGAAALAIRLGRCGEVCQRRAEVGARIVAERQDERVAFERRLHDAALDTAS